MTTNPKLGDAFPEKCNCGEELRFIFCWDNGESFAYNLYACRSCGAVIKHDIWSNEGMVAIAHDGAIYQGFKRE